MDALKAHRDMALDAWEKAVAATVVHYINDTLQDMGKMELDYSFSDHAKHWSEMKGFALGLQFNRFSPLSDADFGTLHNYMGTQPVLEEPLNRGVKLGTVRGDYRKAAMTSTQLSWETTMVKMVGNYTGGVSLANWYAGASRPHGGHRRHSLRPAPTVTAIQVHR